MAVKQKTNKALETAEERILGLSARIEERILTCDDLDALISGAARVRKTFDIVEHDLIMLQKEAEIIYAIDFLELYGYLWPQVRDARHSQLGAEILRASNIRFTILPGVAIELVRHLKRFEIENAIEKQRINDFLNKPMVQTFLRAIERSTSLEQIAELGDSVISVSEEFFKISNSSLTLTRLAQLMNAPTFVPFDLLAKEFSTPLLPDEQVLREVDVLLTLRRRDYQPINNYVDAHNYALVKTLTDADDQRVFLLTTSSPVCLDVFRNFKWQHSPYHVGRDSLGPYSLARHPTHVLYLSKLIENGDLTKAKREIRSMKSSLNTMQEAWSKVPEYRKYIRKLLPPARKIMLPATEEYVRSHVRFHGLYFSRFATVFNALRSDLISEENTRRLRDVSTFGVDTRIGGLDDGGQRLTSLKAILERYEQLHSQTSDLLKQFSSSVRRMPSELVDAVDTDRVMSDGPGINIVSKKNKKYSCIQFTAKDRHNEFMLGADVYDDYLSIWWNTKTTFVSFLGEALRFLTESSYIAKDLRVSHVDEKHFDGVYFYGHSLSQLVKRDLEYIEDFMPSEILQIARDIRDVQMIRIATLYGDLWYDLGQVRGLPQRSGVLTHLDLRHSVGWLVSTTNRAAVGHADTTMLLDRIFNSLGERRRLNK